MCIYGLLTRWYRMPWRYSNDGDDNNSIHDDHDSQEGVVTEQSQNSHKFVTIFSRPAMSLQSLQLPCKISRPYLKGANDFNSTKTITFTVRKQECNEPAGWLHMFRLSYYSHTQYNPATRHRTSAPYLRVLILYRLRGRIG